MWTCPNFDPKSYKYSYFFSSKLNRESIFLSYFTEFQSMFVRRNDPTGAMSSAELRKISRISRRQLFWETCYFTPDISICKKHFSCQAHKFTLAHNINFMPYLVADRRVHCPNSLLLLISRAFFVAFRWKRGENVRCTFLLSEEMGLRFLGENGFWISARMGFVGGLGLGGRVSREQPSSPVGTHRAEKEHVRRHRAV